MSLLRSNNANFVITLQWLKKRGYTLYDYNIMGMKIKEGDARYREAFWTAKSDAHFDLHKRLTIFLDENDSNKVDRIGFFPITNHISKVIPGDDYERFVELEKMVDCIEQ